MVVSTYGLMCDDLLRLLWFLAETRFEADVHSGVEDVDFDHVRQIKRIAASLRSRIACATAVGVAKRLACLPPYHFLRAKPSVPKETLDFYLDQPLFPS
jgi:hypothetical protein